MSENIVIAEDWEVFCNEYEDWLRNEWTQFIEGGEENEVV